MRPFPKRLRRKSARHWRAAPETGHSVLSKHRRPSSRRPLLADLAGAPGGFGLAA